MNDTEGRLLSNAVRRGECLVWTGAANQNGYGRIRIASRLMTVHRVAYELWVGPIPDGLEVDHLCRNRACIERTHLEPVTHWENLRRSSNVIGQNINKVECTNGHMLPVAVDGRRECRACQRIRVACDSCGKLISRRNLSRHRARIHEVAA